MHSLAFCDDPLLDPLMEFCAAHDVPVLQHTWKQVGPEGPGSGNFPNEATPERLAQPGPAAPRGEVLRRPRRGRLGVGRRPPDKQVDNIWLDMGGGEAIVGFMDLALRGLGPSRIVFGTDIWGRSIPSQVSRIVACDLSDRTWSACCWRNAAGRAGGPPAGPLAGALRPMTRADCARPRPDGRPRSPGQPPASLRPPSPAPGGLVDANSFLGEWPGAALERLAAAGPAKRSSRSACG